MARRKRRKKLIQKRIFLASCFILFVTVCVLLVVLIVGIANSVKYNKIIEKDLIVEAGSPTLTVEDFIKNNYKNHSIASKSDLAAIDTAKLGVHKVKIDCGGKILDCKVTVKDTVKPTAKAVDNAKLFIGIEPDANDLVTDIVDATEVTVSFKDKPDVKNAGKKQVTVVLKDQAGNKTEIKVTATVVKDTTPPVISGAKDIKVYLGGTVSYRNNVTVTDDFDLNPTLSIDSSNVNIGELGTYTVIYSAADRSGNKSQKTVNVKVGLEVQSDDDKKLAAKNLADNVLKSIIKDGMTDRQKVEAIYKWARGNIGYSGHSDKSDYKIEAYNTLKKLSGDCFSYFAVTKVMLESLGIPNIDVVKVKNYDGDSSHFWSLVSVDGGNTYYHFDSTPRKGTGDDFCLVTDEFLDAYSNSHNKCHNRDKSLYPATPTK